MIIIALIEMLGVTSIAPFMAVVTDPEVIQKNKYLKSAFLYWELRTSNEFIVYLGYIVFVILLVGNLLSLLMKWYMTSYGQQLGRMIGTRLFKNYLGQSYLFHTCHNSSTLINNIVLEVTRLTNNVIINLLTLNSRLISIILIGMGLFFVNVKITLLTGLLFGGSYIFVYFLFKKKLTQNSIKMSKDSIRRFKIINEGLGGIKELKLHGKELIYIENYDSTIDSYAKVTTNNMMFSIIPKYVLEVIAFGGLVLGIVYLIQKGAAFTHFLPILSLFAMAALKLLPSLQQLFSSSTLVKSNAHAINLIYDDLVRESESFRVKRTEPLQLMDSILVDNLSFSYPSSKTRVLNSINLNIEARKSVAFVGASGSGKSTLVDCLLGLLKPEEGCICVDGNNIYEGKNLDKWQSSIGYVPQTIYLLDSTIAQNIAFSLSEEDIDMEKVIAASRLAQIEDFIESTPNKYKSFVGERGVQLSGGQRQRIGIARALYNNPSVLIFDEATSALDNSTEKEIIDAIYGLAGFKTLVMVAHRLSTVMKCDEIFLMDKGKVIDRGSFGELLDRNTQFQKMVNG